MTNPSIRSKSASSALLVTLLAGMLILPGSAVARGDRDWDRDARADRWGERYAQGSTRHCWYRHGPVSDDRYREPDHRRHRVVILDRPTRRWTIEPNLTPDRHRHDRWRAVILDSAW